MDHERLAVAELHVAAVPVSVSEHAGSVADLFQPLAYGRAEFVEPRRGRAPFSIEVDVAVIRDRPDAVLLVVPLDLCGSWS
jgi:hypothetical protein